MQRLSVRNWARFRDLMKPPGQAAVGALTIGTYRPLFRSDQDGRPVRLHRFRGELSEEVKPVFDADGQIDIQGTTQAITSVLENWIREYPDQWLRLHRRWR